MEHAEGYRWRERRLREWQAWQTHCLISAWTKAPSVQELLQPFELQSGDAEAAMDALIDGPPDPMTSLDKAYAAQAARKVDVSH